VKRSLLDYLPGNTELRVINEVDGEVVEGQLVGQFGSAPIVRGIPRFVSSDTYAYSFGLQWNRYRETQLDSRNGQRRSYQAFVARTGFDPSKFAGKRVLDVGCGAGRFTELFADAGAEIVAVDLSSAVEAANKNVGQRRGVHVVQADLFSLPFLPASFDLVFSLGVLHHTPSAERATRGLIPFLRAEGTLAVWLYATSPVPWGDPLDNAWRSVTRRFPPETLFNLARVAVPLGSLLRTISRVPLVGGKAVALYSSVLPKVSLDPDPAWRVLDTFDWWSPRYRSFHTYQQVEAWLDQEGLVEIARLGVPVALRGRKAPAVPTRNSQI
jgi:SAM-dependent methyltransferase